MADLGQMEARRVCVCGHNLSLHADFPDPLGRARLRCIRALCPCVRFVDR